MNRQTDMQSIEVQGVKVQLTFSETSNKEIPALVRDILKKSYAQRKAA